MYLLSILYNSTLLTIAHGLMNSNPFEDLILFTIILFPLSIPFLIYSIHHQVKYYSQGQVESLYKSSFFLISNFVYAFFAMKYEMSIGLVFMMWAIFWVIFTIISYQRFN